jgi:arylsulfatase A-like enzyme
MSVAPDLRGGRNFPGTVKNQLFAALDWLPTFVDIAGGPKGDGLANIRAYTRRR